MKVLTKHDNNIANDAMMTTTIATMTITTMVITTTTITTMMTKGNTNLRRRRDAHAEMLRAS